jgi:hypothetical protein
VAYWCRLAAQLQPLGSAGLPLAINVVVYAKEFHPQESTSMILHFSSVVGSWLYRTRRVLDHSFRHDPCFGFFRFDLGNHYYLGGRAQRRSEATF